MMHRLLIQVALPVAPDKLFDYQVASHLPMPAVGARVLVPFGSRQLIGIVMNTIEPITSDILATKLKSIIALPDNNEPLLSADSQKLAQWLSDYYHYPIGQTVFGLLPAVFKQNKPLSQKNHLWQIHPNADTQKKLSPAQKKAVQILQNQGAVFEFELKSHQISQSTLKTLVACNIVQQSTAENITPSQAQPKQAALAPSEEQALAINAITHSVHTNQYRAFLLQGVTGSGKTEVYLQAMQSVLAKGQQVLILVPEIGLTPQTAERFLARYCANILVLHSNLNDNERYLGYKACQNGYAQIIIGTRSSLLYDFHHLGMIIIDEAHDSSYKQQDHLRYYACHVAMYLAHQKNIPIVLGTATPTLEMLHLCNKNKLNRLMLNQRASGFMPKYRLVDTRTNQLAPNMAGKKMTLTQITIDAIAQTLAAGKQVLIFINRRGYAPILLCQACGFIADCPRCDAHLTVHKSTLTRASYTDFLQCHHCQYRCAIPNHCPDCGSSNLDFLGVGTSAVYEQLHSLFANPQAIQNPYPILQIDRDTMRKKDDWQTIYRTIQQGEPMIMIGTQMLSKGHHFDKVELVVILDADRGFLAPNVSASETTAALITQVAGRAGRGGAGMVLIETTQPEHPSLQILIKDGYVALAHHLLKERQLLGLPPFSYAASIRAESKSPADAKDLILALKHSLPSPHPFAVLAPMAMPLTKKNNRYFCAMLILSPTRPQLQHLLSTWWRDVQDSKSTIGKHIHQIKHAHDRLILDVDPINL